MESLKLLRGDLLNVEEEFHRMKTNQEQEIPRGGIKDLFSSRENLVPLLISMVLMVGQQFCGVSAIMFYTPKIFSYAGTH